MAENWSPDAYILAWDFASHAHQGQTYSGPKEGQRIAYINHIGSVAMEVLWALGSAPEADGNLALQSALLHDVLEDTPCTFEELVALFGKAVAEGVSALTKNTTLPSKKAQMLDSLARIQQQAPEIWIVKMADRISNLQYPAYHWNSEKIRAYHEEALLIYETLKSAHPRLSERLLSKIKIYENWF